METEDTEPNEYVKILFRRSNAGTSECIPLSRLMRQREISGRNGLRRHITAQFPISSMNLVIHGRGRPSIRKSNEIFRRRGGFLGVSHDTKYLVAMHMLTATQADLYFFQLFPRKAIMTHMVRMTEFPQRGLVKMFFPPSGGHAATAVRSLSSIMNTDESTKGAPNSFEMQMHLFIPSHNVHYSSSSTVTQTLRSYKGNTMKTKNFLHVHDGGAIMNCGVAFVNTQIMDRLPTMQTAGISTRKTWSITNNRCASNKVHLDLGEWISVAPSLTHEIFAGSHYGFIPVPVPGEKENVNSSNGGFSFPPDRPPDILPGVSSVLYISRQSVDIEKCIDLCVKRIFSTDQRRYQGFVDYECDVAYVEEGHAHFVIFCVAEVQVIRRVDEVRNEFYLTNFQMKWDLFNGGVYRKGGVSVLRKLTPAEAFSPQNWYPLRAFPVESSDDVRSINNMPMFTAVNENYLKSPSGNFELACESLD